MLPRSILIATIFAFLAPISVSAEERASLDCHVGPVQKTFGKTEWSVYSCNDDRSVVFVAAAGSPAAPFVFIFAAQPTGYRLHGEGTGRKEATAAAYEDLKELSDNEVTALVEETKAYAKRLADVRAAGAKEEKRIERATYDYLSLKDAGNYKDAYALLAESLKAKIAFEDWRASGEGFNALAGSVKKREIIKITWYKDPPSGSPGIYAAADFDSVFDNIGIHCGFVVWRKEADGSFRVVREEQNYIDRKTLQGLDDEGLKAVKAKFGVGCQ